MMTQLRHLSPLLPTRLLVPQLPLLLTSPLPSVRQPLHRLLRILQKPHLLIRPSPIPIEPIRLTLI